MKESDNIRRGGSDIARNTEKSPNQIVDIFAGAKKTVSGRDEKELKANLEKAYAEGWKSSGRKIVVEYNARKKPIRYYLDVIRSEVKANQEVVLPEGAKMLSNGKYVMRKKIKRE